MIRTGNILPATPITIFIEERCGEDDDDDEDLCIYGVGKLHHAITVTPR
jgi:hypothetical protein